MRRMDPVSEPLAGRRVLLGVTGGIAAYKAADLVRRLKEAGAEVQVVMTAAAEQFVTTLTFQALSGRPVRTSLFDREAEAAMGHIELARWPDLILVAPASADCLARLAQGQADDLLATLCLASERPLAVAPAMNRLMWAHAATQANLATLRARGVAVLGPGAGSQACGETGEGRMLEPVELRDAVIDLVSRGPLKGVGVVVTAGPTREPIDPVRYISNRSSGKMGYAIAHAARERGATVTLVSGPTALKAPSGIEVTNVITAEEMHAAVLAAAPRHQIVIKAAAVSDFAPRTIADRKIKKRDGVEELTLTLKRNPDILSDVARLKPRPFIVAFAAETEAVEANAREKLHRKGADLIVANDVKDATIGFDSDQNEVLIIAASDGSATRVAKSAKREVANRLLDVIVARLK